MFQERTLNMFLVVLLVLIPLIALASDEPLQVLGLIWRLVVVAW
jgi:hypothetical protein